MSNAISPIKAISRKVTTPNISLIQQFEDKLVAPTNNIKPVLEIDQGVNNIPSSFDEALQVLSDFQDKKDSISQERSLLMKDISESQKSNFDNISNNTDSSNVREYKGPNTIENNASNFDDYERNHSDDDSSGKTDMVKMAKKSAENIDKSLVLQTRMMDVSNKYTVHMTMFSIGTSFITSIQNGFKKLIQM